MFPSVHLCDWGFASVQFLKMCVFCVFLQQLPQLPAKEHAQRLRKEQPIVLSAETKQNVRATKQVKRGFVLLFAFSHFFKKYFYEYYVGLFKYMNQRKARLEMVEREVRLMPGDTGIARKMDYFAKETRYLRQRRRKMRLGEFQLLAVLGKGAFGVVYLGRKRDTGEVVAVKKISKEQFDASNRARVMREKKVLESAADNPWLVGLAYAFQDKVRMRGRAVFLFLTRAFFFSVVLKDSLYLAMEYVPGGDLRGLLANIGCLEEEMARFYLVEMVASVSTLHKLGVVHRWVLLFVCSAFVLTEEGCFCCSDLKPDNFLIASSGHLKLGDFGLSKQGLDLQYKETLSSFRGGMTMKALSQGLDFSTRLASYKQKQLESSKGNSGWLADRICVVD